MKPRLYAHRSAIEAYMEAIRQGRSVFRWREADFVGQRATLYRHGVSPVADERRVFNAREAAHA